MSGPIKLTQADARRALVRHHFAPCASQVEAFDRLRSIQFDPIAPVGCNHDLVLQARLPGYKIGDWEKLAYEDRHVYDGWDKQASLVPFEGWPLRRLFYDIHPQWFADKIFDKQSHAVEAILREIEARGPLMPKDFDFQDRREDWQGSWFGPSVTKQVLRALWHSGKIMTSGRKSGQHIYDLTERVVPKHLLETPKLSQAEAQRELVLERHRAMGLVRPGASGEVWSYEALSYVKKEMIASLAAAGEIVPVDVDGMKAHAMPSLLNLLDQPAEPRVVFIAPLDPFMWDRKMIAQLFGFEYIWEIYTPEAKRKWGYYVLPILFGDALVARIEFFCRAGVLEVRQWHTEAAGLPAGFWEAFEPAYREFMRYCSATTVTVAEHIDAPTRKLLAKRRA